MIVRDLRQYGPVGSVVRSERGVAGVLAVATVMVLVSVAAIGVLGMTYAAAARSVRAAADLVAVSGAQANAQGTDACDEAARMAARNQVELSGCEVAGDLIDHVVEVTVRRPVGWRLPGLPDRVSATAYAGSVSGVP
ncbi:MAG: flp pilus-assembly TadE/G-like family protein [Micropruina sp.]|nr:flp pilus-assembly TadE/G-like family protein [Micropruina sp.]